MHRSVVLLVMILSVPAAAADSGVGIRAELGFNGRFRIDSFTPVRVTVSNSGDDRDVVVVVSPLNPSGGADTHLAAINLPRNTVKTIEFTVLMSAGQATENDGAGAVTVPVAALERRGRVLAKTSAKGTAFRDDLLVLCAGPPCRSIGNLGIEQIHGRIVRVPVTEIPSDESALEGVDAILIAEPGETLLEFPEKASALLKYVRSGGLLIAWDRPQNFVNPLPQWKGFAPGLSVESAEVGPCLEGFGPVLVTGAAATRLDDSSGERLFGDHKGALAVAVRAGTGCAVFLSYDPGDEKTVTALEQERVFAALLKKHGRSFPAEANQYGDWIQAAAASVCDVEVGRPASYAVFIFLFAAFAVAAGPGAALAVGRRRRPFVWLLVPLLSVGVSAAAYLYATAGRPGQFRLFQLTFADLSADGSSGSFDAVAGLFAPNRGWYEIEHPGPGGNAGSHPQFMERGWRYRGVRLAGVDTRIAGVHSFTAKMNPYSVRAFRASGELPRHFLDRARGGFGIVETGEGEFLVENRSSIRLAGGYVLRGESAARFGPLNPGEKVETESYFMFENVQHVLDVKGIRDMLAGTSDSIEFPGIIAYSMIFGSWCPFDRRIPSGGGYALLAAFTDETVAALSLAGSGTNAVEASVIMSVVKTEAR